MLESWINDLRYSTRRLLSRPTYALLAALTLALGAGGTAAIFGIVREILLEPLPIAGEEQVGVLWFDGSWTEQEFLHFRPRFPGFQRVAAYRDEDATLEIAGQPLRLVRGITSSAELFDVIGTGPLFGRTFQAGDDAIGAQPVAVLSHRLWQELGSDATIVGRPLQLGGVARTVVGVMPPGFWFPNPMIGVWTSTPLDPQNRSGRYTLLGRIEAGTTMAGLSGPLASLGRSLGERFQYPPQWDKTKAPAITPIREFLVGDVRPSLIATLVAMALILAIACVNVAALMLGQLGGRSIELAVRTALGAERRRLIRQLLIESLLVGAVAGVAGALLAAGGFRILVRSLPLGALAESATLDWSVFAASIGVGLIAASAIAIVPAIAIWRGSLQSTMSTARTGGVNVRGGRLEGALVVAQIALAVLLAAGAGLLIRSVTNLRSIDPGFEVQARAIIDTTMPTQLSTDERRRVVLDVLPSLAAMPGVRAVGATQKLPLRGSGDNWGIRIDGKPELPPSTTAFRIVTHEYFRAMNTPITRGRSFLPTDRATTRRVVVINEALAAKYFAGEDPIGRVIQTGFDRNGEQIIGVVRTMAEAELTDEPQPARYMLYDQVPLLSHEVSFVIAAANDGDLPRLIQHARSTLQRDATRLALQSTSTMATVFDDAVGAPGRIATLLTLLAGLALVLGAIGVYGVIAHFVGRRTRDYGICIALGLRPHRVVRAVVSRGVMLAAAGCAIGIAATLAMTRSLASLLYGVSAADPAALFGAVAALMTVSALAAFIPARRASRTDPAVVLRQQS